MFIHLYRLFMCFPSLALTERLIVFGGRMWTAELFQFRRQKKEQGELNTQTRTQTHTHNAFRGNQKQFACQSNSQQPTATATTKSTSVERRRRKKFTEIRPVTVIEYAPTPRQISRTHRTTANNIHTLSRIHSIRPLFFRNRPEEPSQCGFSAK